MIIIELNEFNPDLMATAAKQLRLDSVARMNDLSRSRTISPDTRERAGLDPWVQWVSVHTGVPSGVHRIKHLADVRKLKVPQIWEVLDEQGISSGIWGAMNARRGSTRNCRFFCPDPWTWTERAYPEELNGFMSLPSYYSKNYLELSAPALVSSIYRTCAYLIRPTAARALFSLLPTIARTVAKYGVKRHLMFSFFDLISTELFIRYCTRYKPEFKILFLNSIAHLQHNQWTDRECLPEEMEAGFFLLDKMLERIFAAFPSPEPLLVINAFSQVCASGAEQHMYRQISPEGFLQRIGIAFHRVEQMMTNDAHVFFGNEKDASDAEHVLRNARVDGDITLFDVSRNADAPLELFFQIDYWNDIPEDSVLEVNGHTLPFYEVFEKMARKTGDHVPEGCILYRDMVPVERMQNHELFNVVKRHYEPA